MLNRIRAEHPHDSIGADIAHLIGIEAAITRAEGRIYDSMVDVLKSPEVDRVIRANLDAIFAGLRAEIGKKDWKKHLGIPRHHFRGVSDINPVSGNPDQKT